MRNLDRIISETIHREINKLIREAEDGGVKKKKFIRRKTVNGGDKFFDYDEYEV